jgi:hypothetical protein
LARIHAPAAVVTIFGPERAYFLLGQHIIVYRIEGPDVLIQRVVRGSRDLGALLHE